MQTAYVNKRKRLIPENWNEVKANTKLLIWTVGLFFKELTQQEILNLFSAKVFKIGNILLIWAEQCLVIGKVRVVKRTYIVFPLGHIRNNEEMLLLY